MKIKQIIGRGRICHQNGSSLLKPILRINRSYIFGPPKALILFGALPFQVEGGNEVYFLIWNFTQQINKTSLVYKTETFETISPPLMQIIRNKQKCGLFN